MHPRQTEMLARADRDACHLAAVAAEGTNALRRALADHATLAVGEVRLEHHAGHRRKRSTARRALDRAAAREEVAHAHLLRVIAGALERESARQVARHEVVAEGGDEPNARLLGGRPVLVED